MTAPMMRVTRVDLDESEIPDAVHVAMSYDVARMLQADHVGCLLYGRFGDEQVTVVWPAALVVKLARLYRDRASDSGPGAEVGRCLSMLCRRFWDCGDEAAGALETTP